MHRRVRPAVATLATLLLLATVVPAAAAAGPTSGPPDVVADWEAGLTCTFAVRSEDWGRTRESVKGDVLRINGAATTRLTNLDHPDQPSVVVHTGATVRIAEPGDGTLEIAANGTTLFFFFPGDVTPVGDDAGGWFLASGRVEETLDATQFVTRFALRGSYRDLCAEIAG
jgi:hypothetical protein